MTIFIFLAFVVPVVGFIAAKTLKDDTYGGRLFSTRESIDVGIADGLLTLATIAAAIWLLIGFFVITLDAQVTIIDMQALAYYAIVVAAIGGTVKGLARHQQ